MQNGTTYYYSAFTYDEVPNYSVTAHAGATPTAAPNVPPTASSGASSLYCGDNNVITITAKDAANNTASSCQDKSEILELGEIP